MLLTARLMHGTCPIIGAVARKEARRGRGYGRGYGRGSGRRWRPLGWDLV